VQLRHQNLPMMDAGLNRPSTRTLAAVFTAVLAVLLVATATSIAQMQGVARGIEQRAAALEQAAARAEATQVRARARADALRGLLAAPTAPARAAADRRLQQVTQEWQTGLSELRTAGAGAAEQLIIEEAGAAAQRVLSAQSDIQQALLRGEVILAQRIFVEQEVEADGALAHAMAKLIDARRTSAMRVARESGDQTRRSFLLLAAAVALVIASVGLAGYALMRRASRNEADLHRERELSEMTLQSIKDGVITVDLEGRVEYMNPVAESLTGWRAVDGRLRPLSEVYRLLDERSREPHSFRPWLGAVDARRTDDETPLRLTGRDGREVSIRHSYVPVHDIGGAVSGAIVVFHDDSNLRSLDQQLSWQASHDALTGLANRREFERRLTELLASASRGGKTHAVMYMDLDHFKAVNDNGGHAAGDELLRQLTSVMQAPMRTTDLLARIGGDEFGALLEACPPDQALRVANQIREAVNGFVFVWQGRQFKVGVTIGLAPIDASSGSVAQVISNADALCYQAKADGRDRVQVYRAQEDPGRRRSSDAHMISQISEAFELNRFVLYVQPVAPLRVELAGSVHREVLVRMLDAQDNLVLPSVFLPAAERYELLGSIDRWVLRTLVEHLGERRVRTADNPEPALRRQRLLDQPAGSRVQGVRARADRNTPDSAGSALSRADRGRRDGQPHPGLRRNA
jgi:diguanylate cyclase (GGDEF)-like protein/PAS domain S-box-containing protein